MRATVQGHNRRIQVTAMRNGFALPLALLPGHRRGRCPPPRGGV